MSAQDKIRVRIHASQRVTFNQIKTMTRAEFIELIGRLENDERFGKRMYDDDAGGWLDLRHIDDWDDLEDIDIYECDENGKKVKQKEK